MTHAQLSGAKNEELLSAYEGKLSSPITRPICFLFFFLWTNPLNKKASRCQLQNDGKRQQQESCHLRVGAALLAFFLALFSSFFFAIAFN